MGVDYSHFSGYLQSPRGNSKFPCLWLFPHIFVGLSKAYLRPSKVKLCRQCKFQSAGHTALPTCSLVAGKGQVLCASATEPTRADQRRSTSWNGQNSKNRETERLGFEDDGICGVGRDTKSKSQSSLETCSNAQRGDVQL